MTLPYFKMQGAGNDFIVINNMELGFSYEQLVALTRHVCQRKLSVGSDALMVVDHPQSEGDIRMIFFNEDGTEAEMCGNGARCLARYAFENHLAKESMVIETLAGPVPAWRLSERLYKVELNAPTVEKFNLSFQGSQSLVVDYIELGDPGLPHLVVPYPDLKNQSLTELVPLAQELRYWAQLPKGANVNFYELLEDGQVVIRTFERGVEGFTYACGTGAGSTGYVLYKKGQVNDPQVTLQALGGELQVAVEAEQLFLIGDTTIVVEGIIRDENLASILK